MCVKKREREERESQNARPARKEESLAPEEGRQQVPEGLQRVNGRYWSGCGGCGGSSALVHSVFTVMLVKTWTSGLGSKPAL